MNDPQRNVAWWGKWLFATYAAAFGLYLVIGLLTLPVIGNSVLDSMFSERAPIYFSILMAVAGPFIYKRLK